MMLPNGTLLRLYDPTCQANSFMLDGFPALKEGKDWQTRLVELIERTGILGMTTNQTLFRQLVELGVLDGRIQSLKAQGRSVQEIYQVLYNEAALQAAKAFESVHSQWPWEGRVSQEASALLTELDPLVAEVRRIAQLMQGVGAFTKIPNLAVGPQAIRQAVSEGTVHPNITLVFSDRHYLQTVEGYLLGLTDRVSRLKSRKVSEAEIRQDLSGITSVNSLFVSRVDRVVDPLIERAYGDSPAGDTPRSGVSPAGLSPLQLLKGKVGIAQAKKIYQMFEAIFFDLPFQDPERLYADAEGRTLLEAIGRLRALYEPLKALGVRPQRMLIASTGVKSDQPYSPLLYLLPFLGAWAANTMPEGTLEHLSRFVAGLSKQELALLKKRNLMRESLPGIPTDIQPSSEWDKALLMSPEERRQKGIADLTPDRILRETVDQILAPRKTSLRAICDTLRDKGAASFSADEQATLQALEAKLTALSV